MSAMFLVTYHMSTHGLYFDIWIKIIRSDPQELIITNKYLFMDKRNTVEFTYC